MVRHLPPCPPLHDNCAWSIIRSSMLNFWNDDWLGYKISDRIGLPLELQATLKDRVCGYFFDGKWHFSVGFICLFAQVIIDLLNLQLVEGSDRRVWPSSISRNYWPKMLTMSYVLSCFAYTWVLGFGPLLFLDVEARRFGEWCMASF